MPRRSGPISESVNKRQASRQPVLKAAKIQCGNAVVDCLVLDLSDRGARVSVETFTSFPDQVTIELRSGGMWTANTRWQRGTETGFEFVRFAGLNGQASADASALYDRLCRAGAREITGRLAENRFFDSPELQEAALALDQAVELLESRLRIAAGRA